MPTRLELIKFNLIAPISGVGFPGYDRETTGDGKFGATGLGADGLSSERRRCH